MQPTVPDYNTLRRGGYLVGTDFGCIQFGAPPETIKDTMGLPCGVPQYFVLPSTMFNWIRGTSLAEIEFPLYYNFFFKKRKTYLIGTTEQLRRLHAVLQESVFGPRLLDIRGDFPEQEGAADEVLPLKRELDYFRNGLSFADLLQTFTFEDDAVTINGVTIRRSDIGPFTVQFPDGRIVSVPSTLDYSPTYRIGERLSEPYRPPLFSITCLGPSHGFDPEENTSGYIIWLNHHGIMVDPPVNSTEWLEASNVNPKLIDSIILTHCHADHDAGTFQKILEEGKVTVYTTETILYSFLRKYSALSGEPVAALHRMIHFVPIKIGTPVFLHGGKFKFFYTLHSIPTLGFKMAFQDQTFVYSSDHNNDPAVHQKLLDTGVISKARYDELRNFPWDSKVIYHESGVPPLHTPIKFLDSLPENIKKKIVVYHIAKKDFPVNTRLTLATFGIENTRTFKTKTPVYEPVYKLLNILKHLDFFSDLPLAKVQEFITIVEEERFSRGETIIRKDTAGDKFFIIYSGSVSIDNKGFAAKKVFGTYEYFGELSLLTGQNRVADIVAETDLVVYTIARDRFMHFIAGTEFEKTLKRLAKNRNSDTWNMLSESKFFKLCSSYQKTWLESILVPLGEVNPGVILKEKDPTERIFLVKDGTVDVSKNGKILYTLGRGDFLGAMHKVADREPSAYTFSNEKPVTLYYLEREDVMAFASRNPGIVMKLSN